MHSRNRKRHILSFLIPLLIVFAAMTISGALMTNQMAGYIRSSGVETMTGVLEQMTQTYDLQVRSVYERLERINRNLFRSENRGISLTVQKGFLTAMTDSESEHILFMKDNGQVLTEEGDECYLDIQTSSLLKLQQKKRIAQSVTWKEGLQKETCFLVAIPCEPYTVDGERFSAIGILYDRSGFDGLLEVSGFGGQAVLLAVDENGIVTYTNQDGEQYTRNYALLRHMKASGTITESQYEHLSEQIVAGATVVEMIELNGVSCYFGFQPLQSTDNKLICVLPASVLNGSLLAYQAVATRMIVLSIVLFAFLCLALILYIAKAASATQRAEFEAENRRIQEEAMAALAIEKDRADHANRAKSLFLSNMSHDIRTPMNAIIGFTSLAITHMDNKEQLQDYLKKICTSSEHLLSLINDVLDMSRIESGKVQINESECSIPIMVHDLRSILLSSINAKRLDFFIDTIDVEHEDVICDKLRVNQVLINIASNAIKYTRPGGTVAVKIAEKHTAPAGFADFEFSVKDTGIGMSPEFLKTIFEPFSREESSTVSKIEGTGLGMAITKNIVDMMGGTISVHSVLGEGSEFTVKLRFRTTKNKKTISVIPELKGFRALVADDNMDSCGSVTKMLRTVGMRPEWTTSGKEAVFRAYMAIDENDPFRVYIIDWLMPDMNGVEVVRRIRKKIGDDVPIIILTAYDWADIEAEARDAGATAFCSKPLFLSELYNALQTVESVPEEFEEPSGEEFQGKRVLLVDDVELNREIAVAILEETGIKVETAENGQIAVDMIVGAKPGYYDLVLMDVMMPVMDGYEATRAIRELEDQKRAAIPIIAMTANAFEEDRLAAIHAGMNDHLSKPIQLDRLYKMMRKYL